MLRLGIVGLPNVGKSTLFNALTSSKAAAAENYPFCTVEPNVGVVEVPDPRLERLNAIVRPKKKVPAVVEFGDIAGLVKGGAQADGLAPCAPPSRPITRKPISSSSPRGSRRSSPSSRRPSARST